MLYRYRTWYEYGILQPRGHRTPGPPNAAVSNTSVTRVVLHWTALSLTRLSEVLRIFSSNSTARAL